MVVYVANPLYDAVFKYLMEDDRIAKTILAALLKKDDQLKEKDEMLRNIIKGMQENGMPLDDIAKMLNKTVDEVKQIEG